MAYWIVNSYGYPNPFSSNVKAREAWEVFELFLKFDSYDSLRKHWQSQGKNPSGIESWKAAFEEFGFLFVLNRDDVINITDAGRQIKIAFDNGSQEDFIWVGLNLILRYPLKGPPRPRPKGESVQHNSDILPYAFLLAIIKDLGVLWRTELDHIVCRTFRADEIENVVSDIQQLRLGQKLLKDFPIVEDPKRGNFYNILNQIIIHASLAFEILLKDDTEIFYNSASLEHKYKVNPKWEGLVNKALGGVSKDGCLSSASFSKRMPRSVNLGSEKEYFKYLGAAVSKIPDEQTTIETINLGGAEAAILVNKKHYEIISETEVIGLIEQLCRIPIDQRVIFSHDLERTYIVTGKTRYENSVILAIRKAKPLSTIHITKLLDGYIS